MITATHDGCPYIDAGWRVARLLLLAGFNPRKIAYTDLPLALEVVWCQQHGILGSDAIARAIRRPRDSVRSVKRSLRAAL
jgi:hypothetical protein